MPKFSLYLSLFLISLLSCNNSQKKSSSSSDSVQGFDWKSRTITLPNDSLELGQSYLSVYSQIYSETEHKTHNLTVTVSIRNVSEKDSIFILNAKYFDTKGNLINTYFDQPVFIAPMETAEIVIDETNKDGGTGANFLFDWAINRTSNAPMFEAIMISTSGQQGLSFSTQGIRTK